MSGRRGQNGKRCCSKPIGSCRACPNDQVIEKSLHVQLAPICRQRAWKDAPRLRVRTAGRNSLRTMQHRGRQSHSEVAPKPIRVVRVQWRDCAWRPAQNQLLCHALRLDRTRCAQRVSLRQNSRSWEATDPIKLKSNTIAACLGCIPPVIFLLLTSCKQNARIAGCNLREDFCQPRPVATPNRPQLCNGFPHRLSRR